MKIGLRGDTTTSNEVGNPIEQPFFLRTKEVQLESWSIEGVPKDLPRAASFLEMPICGCNGDGNEM